MLGTLYTLGLKWVNMYQLDRFVAVQSRKPERENDSEEEADLQRSKSQWYENGCMQDVPSKEAS